MSEKPYRRGPYGKGIVKKKCSTTLSNEVLESIEDEDHEIVKRAYKKRKTKRLHNNDEPSVHNEYDGEADETQSDISVQQTGEPELEVESCAMEISDTTASNDENNARTDTETTSREDEFCIEDLLKHHDYNLRVDDIKDDENLISLENLEEFDILDDSLFTDDDTCITEDSTTDEDCTMKDNDDILNEDNDNIPLYDGANITLGAFMLLLALLFSQNNIVGEIIEQILTVIGLALPKGHKLCTTLYTFKKYFRNLKNPLIKHFYCSNCLLYLEDKAVAMCPNKMCNKVLTNSNKSYFLEISLDKQIQNFFSQESFYSKLQHRFQRNPTGYMDIYDGELYKSYCVNDGPLNSGDNLSFLLNTDGAPVFKSSKVAIWPLYLAINELPFKERMKTENMLLAGLWFGPSKPSMSTFLKPLNESLNIFSEGVICKSPERGSFMCKAYLLAITADLPAKSLLCNCVQFNGSYSCWRCKQKGETVSRGKGHTHAYPFQTESPKGPARTRECIIRDSITAVGDKKKQHSK
ncbi:Hypothetical predicted protein [Mytilus galloprovincialis]|uniref:Transposase domain-containing protein n=1 Tax=Mytilus galloprovincialis TaxID=29158 RepID=A0A8B6GX33_MYTGA|nr:Hypothetical predicted protein [Mytilus galloprovincialis]